VLGDLKWFYANWMRRKLQSELRRSDKAEAGLLK
jgi:hypothetical protein